MWATRLSRATTRTACNGSARTSTSQVPGPQASTATTVAAASGISPIAGTMTDSYEYDAYGNSFTVSGSTPNEFMYRGEQYDSDLGLYYLRARYYNPLTGRFLGRDPEDPGLLDSDGIPTDPKRLHKYLYAGGDPINRVDPNGRDDEEDEGFIDARILQWGQNARKWATKEARIAYCLRFVFLLLIGPRPDLDSLKAFSRCLWVTAGPFN